MIFPDDPRGEVRQSENWVKAEHGVEIQGAEFVIMSRRDAITLALVVAASLILWLPIVSILILAFGSKAWFFLLAIPAVLAATKFLTRI